MDIFWTSEAGNRQLNPETHHPPPPLSRPFQIGLISPYSNLSAIGLRYISAALRAAGYPTRLIFLPNPAELRYKPQPHPQDYPPDVLDQVIELCHGLDMVGMTVMSNYFGRARAVTRAVHERLGLPVIWGGIHPTVKPEECLQWADFVCVGEGEEAVVELLSAVRTGQDPYHIPNIWGRDDHGQIHANLSRPIYQDLDALAQPDYELDHQYLLHNGRIVPLTPALLSPYLLNPVATQLKVAYMTSSTRGCPYRCSFCCDSALADMFPKWRQLRRRSPENLVEEIHNIRAILPNLEAVMFIDSTFLAVPTDAIVRFSQVYREQVGLPFFVMTTPGTVKADKIRPLVEAGLVDVGMGIQTGSERMRALYNRYETNPQILEAGRLLQHYQAQIPFPTYDLISDNPYETDEDKLETLRLLYDLPRPHRLHFFSLTFYPGTEMYRRAKADGLVQDDERDVYAKSYLGLAANYYNFVLWCLHRNLPRWLLRPLIQPFALKLFSAKVIGRPFQALFSAVSGWRARYQLLRHRRKAPRLAS